MKTEKGEFIKKQNEQEKDLCKYSVSFIMPKKELIKQRRKQEDVYLEFPIGEYAILPDYRNNSTEILKIKNLIKEIDTDENSEIIEICLDCFTSPSGSYIFNQETSTKRAYALKRYIQFLYGFSDNLFKAKGMSDDWNRLEQLLMESDMEGKEEALYIIWNTGIFEGREESLKYLGNGTVYQYIQKHFYPLLSRFKCSVTYSILPFDTEKGKQILKTNPELLSLDELYQIARTYKSYTPMYNEIMDMIIELYPNDKTANLNAAALALKYNDVALAEKYLDHSVVNTPEYLNNKGIFYAIKRNYKKAWQTFKKAIEKGSNDGEYNLVIMEKEKICV
ncbi:MAG: hypothetical protein LBV72_18405 [Tannerella sp.]|jgi:hypothetical protein|nr:hypothetical protein [Tannerella sp.]